EGKTDLVSFNNAWYKPGASFLKRGFWYCFNNVFFCSRFPFSGFKVFLLRLFGAEVGSKVVIKPGVNIKSPWLLSIGNYVWIGENAWIDNLVKVSIGSNVCISQGAMLLTGNHDYKKSTFDLIAKEIILEEGVWIGAKAVVCPGVRCLSHAVLAVGSIATENLDAYGIYQGNPAVKIRERKISSNKQDPR
ncbi:MAG TPA: WcaF family extracellular polysaccharide biosynthesis acetyltransferase, partial [Bacteroidia bacterium]|nr:WcaF family extracellular polysaccharide biosynthesis acetyltransferase [Bacteroidia bacterium]